MSAPPKTVLSVSPAEEAAIRDAVRAADPATLSAGRLIAGPQHVDDLVDLLSDPEVSEAIYDLPRPIDAAHVGPWVLDYLAKRARGEGLLFVTPDWGKGIVSYSQITVWPDRAAAELAGAVRADMQGAGGGGEGALRSFGWMFSALKVRLICLTAATDNIRSIRLIDRAGFERMGERDAVRPDRSIRKSHYWEMSLERWETLRSQR